MSHRSPFDPVESPYNNPSMSIADGIHNQSIIRKSWNCCYKKLWFPANCFQTNPLSRNKQNPSMAPYKCPTSSMKLTFSIALSYE